METIDWVAAVILNELRAGGLDESTIVVFTSDNGSRARDGGSNAPLRGTKGTTWEGGMRVPCIVRWPGHVMPGTDDPMSWRRRSTCIPRSPRCAVRRCRRTGPSTVSISPPCVFDDGPASPRETCWYYLMNDLEAVRAGPWKLHLAKMGTPLTELYDVVSDPSESVDRAAERTEEVARLEAIANVARRSLGDARLGTAGTDVRPIGRVTDPVPLTIYDASYPYYQAEYDLPDRG